MPVCVFVNCRSGEHVRTRYCKRDPSVVLRRFPKDPGLCKLWLQLSGSKKNINFKLGI